MRYTVAIDSFKGSLTSIEAGQAAAEGIKRADSNAEVTVLPLADGGEGTVDALAEGLGGVFRYAKVKDPLGRPVRARYAVIESSGTAIIEMSAASGITLLHPDELDPMSASTYGTGELIMAALREGCRRFIIGIGGSATNDGGSGCLRALGFSFRDKDGGEIPPGARGLAGLVTVSREGVPPELSECSFHVICDVDNPLCGERGCSAMFSPQKGAKPQDIPLMDGYLRRFYEKTKELIPEADKDCPGAGAAGGLGFGLRYYLNAELEPGAEMIVRETGLEEHIMASDLVITGEGRIDGQTVMGKAPSAVAGLARNHRKKCIAVGGMIGEGARACNDSGITAYFPIIRTVATLEQCMEKDFASAALRDTVEQIVRLLV